jgi:GMP synthase (glutamine-hydrolysing)
VSAPRILVVDGNVAELRARLIAALGYDSGTGYARILNRLMPDLVCDIIRPADAAPALPAGVSLASYDGVTITGSALNVYNGGGAIERQIEIAKAVFEAGVPFFGSCWGLQIAVVAAGGVVRKNPRGREFGFARRITLTEAGRAHALFAGKPLVFEAPTIHRDDIGSLPPGAVPLASNDMGLQAAAFNYRRTTFWGVQYHPEYDYVDIAAAAERYGRTLIEEGMFHDQPALHEFARELRQLQVQPADTALLWKHGLGPALADEAVRLLEIRNWLEQQVVPRCRQHD